MTVEIACLCYASTCSCVVTVVPLALEPKVVVDKTRNALLSPIGCYFLTIDNGEHNGSLHKEASDVRPCTNKLVAQGSLSAGPQQIHMSLYWSPKSSHIWAP
jgi:hypothetical protein